MPEQAHHTDAAHGVNNLLAVLAQIDPDEMLAAARGLMALMASLNAIGDKDSVLCALLHRVGLLTKAAYIPDGGTYNAAALQFLMGCSEDTVRRAEKLAGLLKKESPRHGATMYRSSRDEGSAARA